MADDFPNDDNGDVLRNMFEAGDSLTVPRDVDFSLLFPGRTAARSFARKFSKVGCRVVVELWDESDPNGQWDVTVTRHMLPEHTAIGQFENELAEAAEPLGGYNDGWGCFRITN